MNVNNTFTATLLPAVHFRNTMFVNLILQIEPRPLPFVKHWALSVGMNGV
jgi:hypothetical protein